VDSGVTLSAEDLAVIAITLDSSIVALVHLDDPGPCNAGGRIICWVDRAATFRGNNCDVRDCEGRRKERSSEETTNDRRHLEERHKAGQMQLTAKLYSCLLGQVTTEGRGKKGLLPSTLYHH
jgi:hypothetical protein